MIIRTLDKRVSALEGPANAGNAVVILNRDGIDRQKAIARWEAENGPIGERDAFVVKFVPVAH